MKNPISFLCKAILPVAVMAAFPVQAASTLLDGLLVNLSFDDSIVNSAAGSSVIPESKGTTGLENYGTGRFGSAASFNNTREDAANTAEWYVSLGVLDYSSSWSLSMWVNIDNSNNHDRALFGNKTWNSGAAPGWAFAQNQNGGFNGERDNDHLDVRLGLTDRTWANVIATFDYENEVISIYVDGVLAGTQKLDAANNINTGDPTTIGAGSDGRLGAKALIDEVGIWNRLLTAEEIALLQDHTIIQAAMIPEPSAAMLALLGFGFAARRRRK